jgi:hypothetical protein
VKDDEPLTISCLGDPRNLGFDLKLLWICLSPGVRGGGASGPPSTGVTCDLAWVDDALLELQRDRHG